MIIIDKREFYALRLDNKTETVLQTLMRSYTGLFADFVPIDEKHLSYASSLSTDDVYQSLLLLSRMHIISYIPKRTLPYVYYPTSRELPKHIVVPRSVYEDRRERAVIRMEAMRSYVFEDNGECRVERMLRYFGESTPEPCGKCDPCRAKRCPTNIIPTLNRLITSSPDGISLDMLRQTFPRNFNQALQQLRLLADQGILKLQNDKFIRI